MTSTTPQPPSDEDASPESADASSTDPSPANDPNQRQGQPVRGFTIARWSSIRTAIMLASNTEKVRAVLAILLVGVLVSIQFFPSGQTQLMTAAETLAISVVAFYFGLHGGGTTGSSTATSNEGGKA